jgi:hypothetical protein
MGWNINRFGEAVYLNLGVFHPVACVRPRWGRFPSTQRSRNLRFNVV